MMFDQFRRARALGFFADDDREFPGRARKLTARAIHLVAYSK
jgi:hypothetical protein